MLNMCNISLYVYVHAEKLEGQLESIKDAETQPGTSLPDQSPEDAGTSAPSDQSNAQSCKAHLLLRDLEVDLLHSGKFILTGKCALPSLPCFQLRVFDFKLLPPSYTISRYCGQTRTGVGYYRNTHPRGGLPCRWHCSAVVLLLHH